MRQIVFYLSHLLILGKLNMTLPASGLLSLADINVELGLNTSAPISLNDAGVRTLLGKSTGAISISDAYGKSNAPSGFALTISTDQANLNLATYATNNGWNGHDPVVVTIATNVFIYATTTTNAGLTTGNFPAGLTIINNGNIIGMGGAGGSGGAGGAGGNALSIGCNCTIQNNGYIAGGGGGGGSSAGAGILNGGGGGAGGGNGGAGFSVAGAIGGAPTRSGATGSGFVAYSYMYANGGGGGRILPGTGGAASGISNPSGSAGGAGGGAGGAGGFTCAYVSFYAGGGAGGTGSNVGGNGTGSTGGAGAGGGGGWGSAGGSGYSTGGVVGYAGGAGGKSVALNGFTVTWTATGTRYGAIA